VYDRDSRKTEGLKGIDVAEDIKGLVENADTVILAVKPQDFDCVLSELKDARRPNLIISVAAGITTGYVERILDNVKVIRAMPNLAAKIGRGMTGLCAGKSAGGDLDWSEDLFYALGEVLAVEEKMMSAVTAVSGSGPAYVCFFLRKGYGKRQFLAEFTKAAEGAGFKKREAVLLADTTFAGTVSFLKRTRTSPDELMKQVASKGGTTEAALAILEGGGSLGEAVLAAKNRADELSKR
ncbi:MAG: pyrroline-5-carboxylate reductase, partial [Candidatus Omnitrophica bacterium]|nr:pyrroline-5-carboxylate reductase [Candidatus Omnitrophota bacterium]